MCVGESNHRVDQNIIDSSYEFDSSHSFIDDKRCLKIWIFYDRLLDVPKI